MCDQYRLAELLYKQGYRKVEENQVILTQEEYEYLCACELDYKEIADELENSKQEWISVVERLPQEEVRVLVAMVYGKNYTKIDTDRIYNNRWVRWGKDVTHWMPLPQPPQIKGE